MQHKRDLFGTLLLTLFLVATSFHFISRDVFVYYRELFAVFFSFFIFKSIFSKIENNRRWKIRAEVFYLCLFPIILILISFVDPKIKLYEGGVSDASELLNDTHATIYIIRNAILYIPMVLYFYIYGISETAIRYLFIVLVAVAPLSILKKLEILYIDKDLSLSMLLLTGHDIIPYNTYVPYLTFPAIICMYFLFGKNNFFLKTYGILILMCLLFFMVLSTSRQSILFCVIAFLFFAINLPQYLRKNFIYFGVAFGIVLFIFLSVVINYELNFNLTSRFISGENLFETTRIQKIYEGLIKLNAFQIFTGAGLTSVFGGPHNDYVQWIQRAGLLPMIISFMPFLLAFKGSFIMMRKSSKSKALYIFIGLSIFFTIFHSMFGHPREDAFQAPFSFLGLALWLGLVRSRTLSDTNVPRDHKIKLNLQKVRLMP